MALAPTLPIWIAVALIILFNDPGPVFFRQKRVGLNGKPFDVYKFRTMYQMKSVLNNVTMQDDPRIFRGGRFIRRYKLDELPQLLNVIKGEMSLVGPRPTVEEDYVRMSPHQRQRFTVLPGMTGLAQISGNTSLPWGKRIEYDMAYINRYSIWLDLWVLYRTALLVVLGRAETHPSGEDEWEEK